MVLDPRTPVLVGAAAVHQRIEDPAAAQEAAVLMAGVARGAAADAGAPGLLDRVDLVLVPEGTWPYTDPGRLVGAPANARTVVAKIGVLQQTLLTRAAEAIASGQAEVVLVVGGEAKYRDLRATITGVAVADTDQPGVVADEVLEPSRDVLPPVEIERELAWPVRQYALIETALGSAQGLSPDALRARVDALWAGFSAVAAGNPLALRRDAIGPDGLAPGPGNPVLATPYTKRHVSQWNVDQAAALLLCSAEVARDAGVATDRWVFPHAGIESNHMVPLSERAALHRVPAVAVAGERLTALTGMAPGDVAHRDIYSCFPVAVRLQVTEMGLTEDRPLTVTGGMGFGGGPLNNYVLQAMSAMVPVLRADPDGAGLVTSVSGMLTKYGLGLWSARPPAAGFAGEDVTAAVGATTPTVAVDPAYAGPATIASATVVHEGGAPALAVVLADTPAGGRAVAVTRDADDLTALAAGDPVGAAVAVDGPTARLT